MEFTYERDAPIAEIAQRFGFSDQAHMTREFKALFGSTPKVARGQLRAIDHDFNDNS